MDQNSADSLEKRIWLHELEKGSLFAPVFPKLSFMEESLKIIFHTPRKPYLWKRRQPENKRQLVARGGYSTIANLPNKNSRDISRDLPNFSQCIKSFMYLFHDFSLYLFRYCRDLCLGNAGLHHGAKENYKEKETWEDKREGKRHIGFVQGDTVAS